MLTRRIHTDIYTKYRRSKIFAKFNQISPTQLAELINQAQIRAGSDLRTDRIIVHQIILSRMKVPWIRQALAEVLGERVEDLWPNSDGYQRRRVA